MRISGSFTGAFHDFQGFSGGFHVAPARVVPRATVSAVFFFFTLHFWVLFLYFGVVFWLLLARVWVSLLGFGEGLFGFVGVFCFFGGFYCSWVSSRFCCCLGVYWGLLLFWVLGFMRVLGVVGCLDFRGSCWVLLYGLAGLFLCILPVYLGAPYAFLVKFLLLIKKKGHNCISTHLIGV
jgi:hypothetical protein